MTDGKKTNKSKLLVIVLAIMTVCIAGIRVRGKHETVSVENEVELTVETITLDNQTIYYDSDLLAYGVDMTTLTTYTDIESGQVYSDDVIVVFDNSEEASTIDEDAFYDSVYGTIVIDGVTVHMDNTLYQDGMYIGEHLYSYDISDLKDVETVILPENDLSDLEELLSTHLDTLEGEWSIYVEDLSTDTVIEINSDKQGSASLIKLFVAGAYEEALMNGTTTQTELSEYYETMMLEYSDNDAWVALETIIGNGSYTDGLDAVNLFAQNNGYDDTSRSRTYESSDLTGEGGNNWTSVHDIGTVLHNIYNGTYVSEEASERILNHLKNQYYTSKIPAGVPNGVTVANKTGELDFIQNDAAIVFGENNDYILVVMSDGMSSTEKAVNEIVWISEQVYQYFNA